MLGLGLPAAGYSVGAGRVRRSETPKAMTPGLSAPAGTAPCTRKSRWAAACSRPANIAVAGVSLAWLPGLDSQVQLASQFSDAQSHDKAQGMQTDLAWSQRLG